MTFSDNTVWCICGGVKGYKCVPNFNAILMLMMTIMTKMVMMMMMMLVMVMVMMIT